MAMVMMCRSMTRMTMMANGDDYDGAVGQESLNYIATVTH